MKTEKYKTVTSIATCQSCWGTGMVKDRKEVNSREFTCALCAGKGQVKVTKEIHIIIETI